MIEIGINTVGFVLSLFLGGLFLSSYRLNRASFLLSGVLHLVFALLILNSLRILIWSPDHLIGFEILSNSLLLLLAPLLYLMAKYEVAVSDSWRRDLYHVLPFVVVLPVLVLVKLFGSQKAFQVVETVFGIFMILSMACYLYLGIRLAVKNKSKVAKPTLYALIGFAVIWHLNLIIQSLEFYTELVGEEGQIWATLLLSFLVLALSYTHWIGLVRKLYKPTSTLNISAGRHREVLSKIDQELAENRSYLDQNFSLQRLSQKIAEPSSYISKVINKEKGVSFPIYISRLRVDEFVRIAPSEENQNLTILGIAEKVGFRSSSTFNKAFKDQMGMLPSEFLKSIRD